MFTFVISSGCFFQKYDPDGLKTITKISQIQLTQTVKLNKTNCKSNQSLKCSFKVTFTLFYLIASNDFFFFLFGNQVICDAACFSHLGDSYKPHFEMRFLFKIWVF